VNAGNANIEHPTSNIECSMAECLFAFRSTFNVRC